VVARYPNTALVASGWLRGEDLMAGPAAVVSIDMNPGRIVLFGLRPQHRAQTHATFPLLFNALYRWAPDVVNDMKCASELEGIAQEMKAAQDLCNTRQEDA
jgi:hypothetical protein